MSLPIRLSDNDVVNTDNLMVELGEEGLPNVDPITDEWIPTTTLTPVGKGLVPIATDTWLTAFAKVSTNSLITRMR